VHTGLTMLFLHRSNRVEVLVEELAQELILRPNPDPISKELVSVQSPSMTRWLAQHLSYRLGSEGGPAEGICANMEHPFPGALVRRLVGDTLNDATMTDSWGPESLRFHILELLPGLVEEEPFSALRRYLAPRGGATPRTTTGAEIGRRDLQLAERIAAAFDRYAVYRPRMVRSWIEGPERPRGQVELAWSDTSWTDVRAGSMGGHVGHIPAWGADVGPKLGTMLAPQETWQAILWRALQSKIGTPSLATRVEQARKILESGQNLDHLRRSLGRRISIFGLATLPPSFLAILLALSRHIDVHLFLLCPSQAYWADIRSRREQLRALGDAMDANGLGAALSAAEGNPLLSSFGRLGRDFQVMLEAADGMDYRDSDERAFVDPRLDSGANLLTQVQNDILALENRRCDAGPTLSDAAARLTVARADRSIQIHACHGPMRQVEVLHQELLRLLDEDPTLEARDILVMTPDLAGYGPLISAVFSQGRLDRDAQGEWGSSGAPALRYSIADQSLRDSNPVAKLVMEVLELARGRLGGPEVLDLLESDWVRRRFGINAEDRPELRRWVLESQIRWGANADHRLEHDQPADSANTWQFGIERLLLGVCMAEEGGLYAGALPFDDMEGDGVRRLGRFVGFCEALFEQLESLRGARPLEAWRNAVDSMLEHLCQCTREQNWMHQQVRFAIEELMKPGCTRELNLEAVIELLGQHFERMGAGGAMGHQTGAMTFCAMLPMRSIPHRVVCLLGLDDAAFPRTAQAESFDLLASHPQIGDRNPRDEDRYILLESLLAARQHWIVTYSGRDPRTNEAQPPAVAIGEILDLLDASFEAEASDVLLRDQLLTQHPLQGFSPANFGVARDEGSRRSSAEAEAESEPKSFDRSLAAGAAHLVNGDQTARSGAFMSTEIPRDMPETDRSFEMEELQRFFENPARGLVRDRLGIRLGEYYDALDDREPVELDSLQDWKLKSKILHARMHGQDSREIGASLVAGGGLPLGTPGRIVLADRLRAVDRLLERASEVLSKKSRTVNLDLHLENVHLYGSLGTDLHGQTLLHMRVGKARDQDLLTLWIQLLAVSLAVPDESFVAMRLATEEKKTTGLALPEEAHERAGMCRNQLLKFVAWAERGGRFPLAYYPKSSVAYGRRYLSESSKRPDCDPSVLHENALVAANRVWLPKAIGAMVLSQGEREDPYIALVHGAGAELEDVQRDSEFSALAREIWQPILAAAVRYEGNFA